jgi:TonB family protein
MTWRLLLLAFPVILAAADRAPKVLHRVEPRYTREARTNGVQGTVVLEVAVDRAGKPTSINVLSPIGFGLDARAVDAVRLWTFQPATSAGQPVDGSLTVDVKFRIFHRRFDPAADDRRNQFNLAVDALHRNRQSHLPPDAATLETLQKLSAQKYAPAMYVYGKLLECGDGVAEDRSGALRLIFEAARAAYPAAMFDIGRMMMEGRRLEKDPEKGLELMRNAAILGNRRAQFYLGVAYMSGYGVPRDSDRANQNFRLCAAAGETPCQVQLAKLLLDNAPRQERDYLQAIAWLQLAAAERNDEAKLILASQSDPLSEKQASWVDQLKGQLVRKP